MTEKQNNDKKQQTPTTINDQSKKVLGGILQNAQMARHSTCTVVKYAKDDKFVDTLNSQIDKYDEYIKKAQDLAKKHEITPEQPNGISKFFVEKSIKMRFAFGTTDSKIAEMMIKGTAMGIIDVGKLLSRADLVCEDCTCLAKDLLTLEEDKINVLKYYL